MSANPTQPIGNDDPGAHSLHRLVRRNCNDCENVLMKGEYVTCGLVMAEVDEDDADLADGIHASFAEMCEDFSPNSPDERPGEKQ